MPTKKLVTKKPIAKKRPIKKAVKKKAVKKPAKKVVKKISKKSVTDTTPRACPAIPLPPPPPPPRKYTAAGVRIPDAKKLKVDAPQVKEAWEIESYKSPTNYSARDGAYKFVTPRGTMYVKPADILVALEEQANMDEEFVAPDADLQGWGVIHASDEEGNSRPLLLMRVLPALVLNKPYSELREDDKAMENIIMEQVYKLTPIRIKWLKLKSTARRWWFNLRKPADKKIVAPKVTKEYKPPKSTEAWLSSTISRDKQL